MKSVPRTAIQKTLRYASFFNFKLTRYETFLYLISAQTYPLPTRKETLSPLRQKQKRLSQKIMARFQQALDLLQKIPTIDLIAVTGSLAMENAKKGDDLDLMIVTKTNTLWLTRLFVVPFFRLLFKSRLPRQKPTSSAICFNLWLDQSALKLPSKKRNLYTAHEVLQIKPLYNRSSTYERFIKQNSWTKNYLANFYKHISTSFTSRSKKQTYQKQRAGYLLQILNLLTFLLQYLYMSPKITSESVTPHSAYFHPRSLATKLDRFLESNSTPSR